MSELRGVIVSHAAVMNRLSPLWEQDDREFTKLVDANIRGVQNVIRHFVPAMVAKKKGVIVNFSSGWGRSVSPEVAPYCMSKWAIEGLTKALAEELPKGMAAVPLNPGKNLTVICEVVAMNHLLRYSGVDTAKAFNERLIKTLKEKRSVREYLEEDYE